jgi:large subunit ribosomal protein L23
MKKFNSFDIIKAPTITEKATSLSEFNKIVFKVNDGASKNTIKRTIEKIFKVNVIKVNTINTKGKTKLIKGKKSIKSGYKKAIVTLKKGQSIDLATGI